MTLTARSGGVPWDGKTMPPDQPARRKWQRQPRPLVKHACLDPDCEIRQHASSQMTILRKTIRVRPGITEAELAEAAHTSQKSVRKLLDQQPDVVRRYTLADQAAPEP